MAQKQIGFVALLIILAILLTAITANTRPVAMGGEGVPGIPDSVYRSPGVGAASMVMPAPRCIDPDGGDTSRAGVVILSNAAHHTILNQIEDACASQMMLREALCENGRIGVAVVRCPFGCMNSACQTSP